MDSSSIKYFQVYPPLNNEQSVSLKNGWQPGDIIEYRPGQLEKRLIVPERGFNRYLAQLRRDIRHWDYGNSFDFKKWLSMQEDITFTKHGYCEFSYRIGDRIIVGPWIKSKMLQMLKNPYQWNSDSKLYINCQYLLRLKEDSSIHEEHPISSETTGVISEEFMPSVNAQNRYYFDVFRDLNLFSNSADVYENYGIMMLTIPFDEGETWGLSNNWELVLSVINQALYRQIFLESKEITGREKTILLNEEFANRIKVYGRESTDKKDYYQAIDDSGATQQLKRLKEEWMITLTIKDYYPNGNIRYFSCRMGDRVSQFADELTSAEARRIFPEDFYYERAYYQVREECQEDFLEWSQNHQTRMHQCECNPNNFYGNGGVKYFWVDYYGNPSDFYKRKQVLEFADEMPTEIAIQLKKADDLAKYQEQAKLKETKEVEVPPTTRQRRLNSKIRTQELTLEQMVTEINGRIKKSKERWDYESGRKELKLDDVILLLRDIMLTEDDARCVTISWNLLQKMDQQDITDDFVTPDQVKELFPALWDESDVSLQAAKIVSIKYNNIAKERMEKRLKWHREKLWQLNALLEQAIE